MPPRRSVVRAYLAEIGRKGGRARARSLGAGARRGAAAKAALARWMKRRFGVVSFAALGLPGSEIVDAGLASLAEGKTDEVEALAVAEAAPRLRFLNVPVPRSAEEVENARVKLYRALEARETGTAHARLLALFERIDSFCNALSVVYDRVPEKRRDRRWCV